MSDVDFYLLLERIDIQGANAISSPLTYGFPALTGFLGAIHALARKMPFPVSLSFGGALVASHACRVKRYRSNNYSDYTLNQTRNPIKRDGKTASIIEEGKVDLTVSLVIPVTCDDFDDEDWLNDNTSDFTTWVEQTLYRQRMAGGSVFAIDNVELLKSEDLDDLKPRLAPAFILMDARQELIAITKSLQQNNPEATALDALLEVAVLHHIPQTDKQGNTEWQTRNVKQGRGWLVPMPIGYQAISPLYDAGSLKDCRSADYPSQFVETLYGLGKWVFPYSLDSLRTAFWRMNSNENSFYLIEQTTDKE